MQLRFRFRPSQNVSFVGGFVSAENEKYGFGRSLLRVLRALREGLQRSAR